jgi:hypothetical protein
MFFLKIRVGWDCDCYFVTYKVGGPHETLAANMSGFQSNCDVCILDVPQKFCK